MKYMYSKMLVHPLAIQHFQMLAVIDLDVFYPVEHHSFLHKINSAASIQMMMSQYLSEAYALGCYRSHWPETFGTC